MKYNVQPLDLMQYINTKYHDPFIHELIEFEDRLDTERLLQAIAKLSDAFPLLKCHYDGESNSYVENDAFSASDLLRLDDTCDRDVLLTEALNLKEKLIQFTLSGKALVITISHLITDGMGFKQLIYLLCELYNGNSGKNLDHLMERDFSQLTKELKGKGTITLKMILSLIGNYKSQAIYEKSDDEGVYIIERALSSATMSRIHALAKKQGATLNDVFLTAYARAIGKRYDLEKTNIPCTVDLRKYANGKTGIANLTGSFNFNIKFKNSEDFGVTLAKASTIMQKQKNSKNDIAGPMSLVSQYEKSTLEKFLKLYGGMDTSAFTDYTNLGVLDDKYLRFDGATIKKAIGYSGLNKAPCFQISVSSFRGETTIATLVKCSNAGKEKADLLMDAIIVEIESFL